MRGQVNNGERGFERESKQRGEGRGDLRAEVNNRERSLKREVNNGDRGFERGGKQWRERA